MYRMTKSTRDEILLLASNASFTALLNNDGSDVFDKLIVLSSPNFGSKVYIDKITGISKIGAILYFKVAVHPDHYDKSYEDLASGIKPAINNKTKKNLHSHSGFSGLPTHAGNHEPIAMAYKVSNADSLKALLKKLAGA